MAFIGKSPSVNRLRLTPQSAAPGNPQEGDRFYSDGTALSEGLWVYKNGLWQPDQPNSNQINYIENSGAENATTGWAEYDDGASATPVDGTGGTAANITLSRNTSSPLRGAGDFDIAKGAADAQGEGVSYDFSIDNADANNVCEISFDYKTSANFSNADMGVYIYDVTGTSIITPSTTDISADTNGGIFSTTFTASANTSYRLILHIKTTNALAYDFNFDNVRVGPQTVTPSGQTLVNFSAIDGSGQSIPNNSETTISFDTVEDDTASGYSSGTYTIPESGRYQVSFSLISSDCSLNAGETFQAVVTLNGTAAGNRIRGFRSDQANTTDFVQIAGHFTYNFTVNDVLRLRLTQVSGASCTLSATDYLNMWSIAKIN